MSLGEAIRSVLQQNYANFSGRARRSEYWYFALGLFIAYIVILILSLVVHAFVFLFLILILGVLVPSLAVQVRRLHDTGRSGWWYFIGFVPFVGGIVLLVFTCQDSQGDNRFGPSPKAFAGGVGGYPQDPAYPAYPPQS